VTIFGLNFGVIHSTTTASLPSAVCSTSFWTSDSSILCQSPGGLGLKISIALTVGGMVGTQQSLFSYDGTRPSAAGRLGRCARLWRLQRLCLRRKLRRTRRRVGAPR
jgi:hypothetical protein